MKISQCAGLRVHAALVKKGKGQKKQRVAWAVHYKNESIWCNSKEERELWVDRITPVMLGVAEIDPSWKKEGWMKTTRKEEDELETFKWNFIEQFTSYVPGVNILGRQFRYGDFATENPILKVVGDIEGAYDWVIKMLLGDSDPLTRADVSRIMNLAGEGTSPLEFYNGLKELDFAIERAMA